MQRTMPSKHFSTTCALSLTQPAKSTGGDKYSATFLFHEGTSDADKDRAIYVPQEFSRFSPRAPEKCLSIALQTQAPVEQNQVGWFKFELVRKAKGSGDDRYSAGDTWKGDIYLPKEFRADNDTVWLRFNEGESA
jgi:hypothetical protein